MDWSRAGPLGGGPRCRPRPGLAHLGWSAGPPGGAAARPSGLGEGEGKGEGSGRCRAESGAGAGRTSRAVAAAAGHGHPTGCGPSFQASAQRSSCREGRGESWAGRCWAPREKGAKICGFIAGWRLRPHHKLPDPRERDWHRAASPCLQQGSGVQEGNWGSD